MSTEAERVDTRKAMAFDLIQIFNKDMEKTYTPEEIIALITAYATGTLK